MVQTVAVIGAGIGGTAAALSLARAGLKPVLYEQAPAIAEVGAGLQIGPNGMAVLQALGLGPHILARASRPAALVMADGRSGRRLARVPFGAEMLARYGAPYVQLHRADLLDVLLTAAREEGVEVRLGQRVTAAEEGGADADLIVAADGLRSAHRAHLNPGTAPDFTGHVAWRALIPVERLRHPPAPLTRLYMGTGRHMVLYPLRGGALLNVVAVIADQTEVAEGWAAAGDPEVLRTAFANWALPVRDVLDALTEVHRWGLFGHAPLAHWTDGTRLALLGDACHPMLPYFAQGAVMALEDAWVLANCLTRAPDLPTALGRYQGARAARTARVQRGAAANGRLYHAPAGPRRMVLRSGMRMVSALPGAPILRKFDWLYGADVTRVQ